LKYANEADDEDYDGADVLDYDCRVCDERPEIVRLEAGIALEMFEEGILIGVIIWVYFHQQLTFHCQLACLQDCFTHNNFFQVPFLLLLPLRFLSLCRPLLGLAASPSTPFVMRRSFCTLLTAEDCFRGGDP
jgi:hypothetical protein